VALLDEDGNVLERYEYDVYGKPYFYDPNFVLLATQESGHENVILYTGQRFDRLDDGDLTIMYYKNRCYNPTTGRFLQRDPIQYKDGMNLYQYVTSNSLSYLDPFGRVKADIKLINYVVRKYGLSDFGRDLLHEAIHGQNLSRILIEEEAEAIQALGGKYIRKPKPGGRGGAFKGPAMGALFILLTTASTASAEEVPVLPPQDRLAVFIKNIELEIEKLEDSGKGCGLCICKRIHVQRKYYYKMPTNQWWDLLNVFHDGNVETVYDINTQNTEEIRLFNGLSDKECFKKSYTLPTPEVEIPDGLEFDDFHATGESDDDIYTRHPYAIWLEKEWRYENYHYWECEID
jgi:RHS repeat-associated protein